MSYTELAGGGLLAAALWDLLILRTRLLGRRGFWVTYAIMLGFQLIVNGVLTGVPVVRYNASAIIGFRIAYAPVEDIAFGFSLILITLATWVALSRR